MSESDGNDIPNEVLHQRAIQKRANLIEQKIEAELPLNKKKRFRIGFTKQVIK